jgi:aerobic carbon-monoxide dehydrogenase small subunit
MSNQRLISFTLNGEQMQVIVSGGETLVELLQNKCDLKGARESCGQGLCGCCTVLVDGQAVSACLSLAWFIDGAQILTIEGLADGDKLDIVQQAFIDAGAFQCGFCTSGFIMMTKKFLTEVPNPTEDQIRHYFVGNLCRCSAYPEIVDAVLMAAARSHQH